MTLALVAEQWIVILLGICICGVALAIYVIRGNSEAAEGTAGGIVKVSGPAWLVALVIGASLVLIGSGFLELNADSNESATTPTPTVQPGPGFLPTDPAPAPTTTTTATTVAPTTTVMAPPAGPIDGGGPGGDLAATGSPLMVTAGVGFILVGLGLRAVRFEIASTP